MIKWNNFQVYGGAFLKLYFSWRNVFSSFVFIAQEKLNIHTNKTTIHLMNWISVLNHQNKEYFIRRRVSKARFCIKPWWVKNSIQQKKLHYKKCEDRPVICWYPWRTKLHFQPLKQKLFYKKTIIKSLV